MATIIKDFAELGKIFHIKPKDKKNNNKKGNGKASGKKNRQSAERKCNKCGAVLRHIPDTNVWVCEARGKSPTLIPRSRFLWIATTRS